jgi:hypothetical protein
MSVELKPCILIVSADADLLAEAGKTTLVREVSPGCLSPTVLAQGAQVVIVDLDEPRGMELVSKLVLAGVPRVVAVAGAGIESWTLEHTLLKAELRGASATLPKPLHIDDILSLVSQPLFAA